MTDPPVQGPLVTSGRNLLNEGFVLCLSVLALSGCASAGTHVAPASHTLAGNPRMPQSDIATFISPTEWGALRELEYERYVVMAANIRPDGSVIVGKVFESFPDASWNHIACSFGKEVILRTSGNTGSMLPNRGEIYVVFFKPVFGRKRVLIFGQQIDEPSRESGGGRMVFVGRQIGIPDLEISHRAKYINTFNY